MKSLRLLISISFLMSLSFQVYPQVVYDFGFQRDLTLPVYDGSNQLLRNAWAGGLNSVHFNEMDLNFDNIKDLVIYDAQTDKLSTYINRGTAGVVDYDYAPEYEQAFPKLYYWVRLKDFNGDGKEDIFTYGFAGIKVYLNTSTQASGLSFQLYTPMLNAYQGGNISNILVTYVDYPAIADIDGDGDLDVLVFFGLGALVQHYENKSMDSTGTLDTLWMVLKNRCWGWFSENADDNGLTLRIDSLDPNMIYYCTQNLKSGPGGGGSGVPKHTGSTMLLLDLDGNNLMDLVIGDTDFPTVAALYNHGSVSNAIITYVDSFFPSYDTSIFIYNLVNTDYLDVNNDGIKDLIAGTFDPGWEVPKSNNYENIWYYKNTGANNFPVFRLQSKSFMQDQMIDVGTNSYPVLFDYDSDGLLDLFVGNFGRCDSSWIDPWITSHSIYVSRISLYRNTGTATQPAFSLVTDDFANVSSLGLVGAYPTFGDINGDGKPDMIMGDTTGRLHYFENIAPAGQPMQLNYVTPNYKGIDVGMYSTPQLFDLDNDGLLDLVIGYQGKIFTHDSVNYYWNTSLAWYKNTGTLTNPQFALQTDTLGGVRVNDSYFHYFDAYSAPCFYRDTNGVISLFVGSGPGFIFYYRDINNNLNGVFGKDSNMVHITDYDQFYSVQHFENKDHVAQTIAMKLKSTVTIADLNGDGYPEMITGNYGGGLSLFKGTPPLGIGIRKPDLAFNGDVSVFPNPASGLVNIVISGADRSLSSKTTLYTITGQECMSVRHNGDDHFRLDVSQLPNGVYLMRIDVTSPQKGTMGSFSRKLIVKR